MTILEIKNLEKYYEDFHALNNLSLSTPEQSIFGILGPNGSGKSTLVDILLGLLDLNKGNLLINKKKFNQRKQYWQSKFAYIPQNIFLMNDTILKNITFKDSLDEVDKKKYEHESNTYYPEIYKDLFPVYLKFFKKHLT